MFVTPETFARQIEYLSGNCHLVSLASLVDGVLRGASFPKHTVAITFDDGWVDNFIHALPILQAFQAPATFFLATAYIGTSRWFWTDKVAFWLQSVASGTTIVENMKNSSSDIAEVIRGYDRYAARPLEEQLSSLFDTIRTFPKEQREEIADELLRAAKPDAPLERTFLNWDEVEQMRAAGLSFCGHSHEHQPYSELSTEEATEDARRSDSILSEHGLNHEKFFCYPGGYWSRGSQGALAAQGMRAAFLASYAQPQIANRKATLLERTPPLFPRINIHEDMSNTTLKFACRIALPNIM